MSKLTDFKLLSFDVYGTFIDWETGILTAFQKYLEKCGAGNRFTRKHLLEVFHELEYRQEVKTPDMLYSQVLTTTHPQWAEKLGLPAPTASESEEFGQSVGKWPAFPDTVDALKRLGKTYKLVVLSNVDRESFGASNAGPLGGVHFDGILTAQDIGSYKPDPRNFDYMLDFAQKEFGIQKSQVLQTAQSQKHDHHPASKKGIKSVWIARAGARMGNVDEEIYNWKFNTLGEMADAVEKEKSA
ncbi:HAD-like protein [Xylona heveae TC161]|uniref:HAD-like protein n=1 Tax=Xylona heveae (strain CBS 132557 / TC161) TaxID=1328760 RepID=A0A165I2N1_XYLHT|nr:HAD-like protein [Xylona heveae TC161]KZF24283.1 HAD-like protein [Xylona heveae TC161]